MGWGLPENERDATTPLVPSASHAVLCGRPLLDGVTEPTVRLAWVPGGADADAIIDGVFREPAYEAVPLSVALTAVRGNHDEEQRRRRGVAYLQTQNSNLTESLGDLIDGGVVPASLPFFDEAFGDRPIAVNLWIGTQHSTTVWHADCVDNVYAVLVGTKTFHLLPPTAAHLLNPTVVPAGAYCIDTACDAAEPGTRFHTHTTDSTVRWFNPTTTPDGAFTVTVSAGSALYLPAHWHHKVTQQPTQQSDVVIAVNYWYEIQRNDPAFTLVKYIDELADKLAAERATTE
eukprot:CAMPEP_0170742488 /NCGR_PEP_ID=MMETSP0437-20130122/6770_1 /TAXON_ID=0 /ORGANISM="Sexangularia sp." /LENGTH=287 /DNA_ID=CAMNT_0011081111 /DNA_START=232 /DNA_END=1095 /DNA_ORIENTATION=-